MAVIRHPSHKFIFLILACGLFAPQGFAQSTPPDPLQQLQQLQGQQGNSSSSGQGISPQTTILEPNAAPNAQLPTSRLEQILSTRAGVRLRQFGYDQLGTGRAVAIPQMGAVQDDYILGPGDEIVVSLRGQENAEYRATVDRDARVVLPRMNPVSASGRTFGDFRRELLAAIHRSYIATEGFVSVGRLRQIGVLVSGEVNSPGVRTLTGLSTPVDAILVSGGIKKTGSMRNVYILRGGQRIKVDLYSVLTGHGQLSHASLADGDRLVVPPLGPTVAVVGWVRRPGIYEMAGGRSSIDLAELLALSGGLEVRGKYRMSILEVASDGRNQMRALENDHAVVRDSDIVFIQPAASQTIGKATLSGGTALAGQYSTRNTKLSELLKSPGALGENPYTLFGMISRRDPTTLLRTLIPFTPVAVLKGADDMNIQSDDIVRVLSAKEAQRLFLTIRRYEERRNRVETALRSPENMMAPIQDAPVNVVPTQPGQAPVQQQNRPTSGVLPEENQDLGSESEAESLNHVERDIELAAHKANRPIPNDTFGQQNAYAGGYSGGQQPQGQPLGAQGNYAGMDQSGMAQQGFGQNMQPLPMNTNQAQQLIGPYSEQRGAFEPPTLGQNLQEQSTAVGQVPTNQDVLKASQLASQVEVDPVVFINFLRDHQMTVGGAVRGGGLYLVGPDADIQSVLQAAGGLARWANRNSIEVISTTVDLTSGTSKTQRNTLSLADAGAAGYIVAPRDEVRVDQIVTDAGGGQVTIQGQIRNPGTYQIARAEHLSDVLARAGGLTQTAYPYGTVFLRRSVAAQEKDAFRREADEIEAQLLVAMSRRDQGKLGSDAFTAVQGYVNQIRTQKPLGRVTIMADPAVLAANPSMDPLLESGDVIYVPQRPYSISVLGEVLQPGSVPYLSDMSASDYIERAGGYSQYADSSQTIVVLPDGSARRIGRSLFGLKFISDEIPPGSAIFVARDISGVDLHSLVIDSSAIFSQLATTAAALAVLSKQ